MSIQDHSRWLTLHDGTSSLSISFYEALSYSQAYETIGGRAQFRTLDGTGVTQQNWAKLKTTVSGNGGVPIGLAGLDYSDTLILSCGVPRAVGSESNVVVIPSAKREDTGYEPRALKRVGGFLIPTLMSLTGNTATIDVDAEADLYTVLYYPKIEVIMVNPSESFDMGEYSTGWSFTAEER